MQRSQILIHIEDVFVLRIKDFIRTYI